MMRCLVMVWWLLGALGVTLGGRGQPEVAQALALPSEDEVAFNHLFPFPFTGGTYHFVSSNFPEIDSRGFHESVFDEIGDYYPSWSSRSLAGGGRLRDLGRKKRSLESKEEEAPNQTDEKRGSKRLGGRYVRGMEMGSSGFHGDTFNSGFGDFMTMRKRRARGSLGFHPDTFSEGFGHFQTMKRRPEMDSMGFHGDTFGGGFGEFETMKKRRPEMDSMGFHGDTFNGNFGYFETMKKRPWESSDFKPKETTNIPTSQLINSLVMGRLYKRRPEMDSMGFHGDTFGGGFGEFETMKKRRPEMDSMGFHGDTFGGGFGEFETMKKRRPEMDSMGFHGDTFGGGFGEFETMKKRKPEMDSMGFHGDTFSRGFGDFDTMKRGRMAHEKVVACNEGCKEAER